MDRRERVMEVQNPHLIILSVGYAIGIAVFMGYMGKLIYREATNLMKNKRRGNTDG
jgi:hypothetical protein